VRTLADLKRIKIRSFGPNVELLDKMGATAMSIPLAEAYLALATGTVDGCHTGWNPMYNMKIYEVCKYGLLPPTIGDSIHHILVNMDAWKALPDDLKSIITLTHRDWSFWHARWYTPNYDIVTLKNLEEKGVKFTTLPKADQAKVLEIAMGMWDKLGAADRVAGEGVKILKDYYKKIGRTR
jgi:TRAP-type C4-dicarboxylate transport system substrate-binding protein